jgi:diguanylate cyclase (GGDEF)-like protein/PAS domain S-box-containing protein
MHFGMNSIGFKLTAVIGVTIATGFATVVFFYTQQHERNILLQNERTVHQIVDSVGEGLNSVMITGSADVAELYADRLKDVKDVEDFRILRNDGLEAFRDNKTINAVNRLRGEVDFEPRPTESALRVLPADDPNLVKVLQTHEFSFSYRKKGDKDVLSFLLPIKSAQKCERCHGKDDAVLGVLEFTTSLDSAYAAVRETRLMAAGVLLAALAAILLLTRWVLRRYIVKPIERVSAAMAKVSTGDLYQEVPVIGSDELAVMARNFNQMTLELRESYLGFNTEHNKLETIIMGTQEGIVATNSFGEIVLLNPAAERLLGKSADEILAAGFLSLFDDRERMERLLEREGRSSERHDIVLYRQRVLDVLATSIHSSAGQLIGHTAILRDITQEKLMEQKLRDLSSVDPLTGLANRRRLNEVLAAEFELSKRQGRAMSILMFDVDHFKRFNDEHGHDTGDRVLQAVAAMTRECVREVLDTVCRYGGEEFMVIARETPEPGGVRLAERIRAAIEEMTVDGLRVTVSIGIAGLQESGAESPAALIEKADAALYEAKRAGRNRVLGATGAAS